MALSAAGNHDVGAEMLEEALRIAEQYRNDRLRGEAIYTSGIHHVVWTRSEAALEALRRATELFEKTGMTWELTNATAFFGQTLILTGRLDEAMAIADKYEPLARRIGNRIPQSMFEGVRNTVGLFRSADLEAYVSSVRNALDVAVGPWKDAGTVGLAVAEFLRGNWELALASVDDASDWPGAGGGGPYIKALIHAYLGDRQAVARILDANRDQLLRIGQPNSFRESTYTSIAVESFYLCQQYEEAAAMRPLVDEMLRSGVLYRAFVSRLTRTLAGMAAAAGSDWDAAQEHYEAAIELAEGLPHLIEQADARRFYAQMLVTRAGSGDQEHARALLEQALKTYDRIGMPRHAALATAILDGA
jgi:tetratricopeptide (TPR) repeat protein